MEHVVFTLGVILIILAVWIAIDNIGAPKKRDRDPYWDDKDKD